MKTTIENPTVVGASGGAISTPKGEYVCMHRIH